MDTQGARSNPNQKARYVESMYAVFIKRQLFKIRSQYHPDKVTPDQIQDDKVNQSKIKEASALVASSHPRALHILDALQLERLILMIEAERRFLDYDWSLPGSQSVWAMEARLQRVQNESYNPRRNTDMKLDVHSLRDRTRASFKRWETEQ